MANAIQDKSLAFAIRIINCYKYLDEEKRERIMSKQLLRCGTSIGANTRESKVRNSSDFQKLDRYKQKETLRTLRDMGASVRQLERLTGLGRGLSPADRSPVPPTPGDKNDLFLHKKNNFVL